MEWFLEIEKEFREMEEKNGIRDPFQAWNNLLDRDWPGIYRATYRLRHSFPRVGLIEHNGVPMFRLTAETVGFNIPGEAKPRKTVVYCGHGVSFRSALCDLLAKIEARAEPGTVWFPYPPDRKHDPELWSDLKAHPLFGVHTPECLKLSFGMDLRVLHPIPVYVFDAGPWRQGQAVADPYLHSAVDNLSVALYLIHDRIQRAYGGVAALPEPEVIREAWSVLQDRLDWFDFSLTADGKVCAELKNLPVELDSRTAIYLRLKLPRPMVCDSFEDTLIRLAKLVKGVAANE